MTCLLFILTVVGAVWFNFHINSFQNLGHFKVGLCEKFIEFHDLPLNAFEYWQFMVDMLLSDWPEDAGWVINSSTDNKEDEIKQNKICWKHLYTPYFLCET